MSVWLACDQVKNSLQLQFPEWPAILYSILLQLSAERVAMRELQEAKYSIVKREMHLRMGKRMLN